MKKKNLISKIMLIVIFINILVASNILSLIKAFADIEIQFTTKNGIDYAQFYTVAKEATSSTVYRTIGWNVDLGKPKGQALRIYLFYTERVNF